METITGKFHQNPLNTVGEDADKIVSPDGRMAQQTDGQTNPLLDSPSTNVRINPIALRTPKILWSFGHSECNRVNIKAKMVSDITN